MKKRSFFPRSIQLQSKLTLCLIFSFFMIVLSFGTFIYMTQLQSNLIQQKSWARKGVEASQQIVVALLDSESAQRGYLLSKDPKSLEPINEAMTKIDQEVVILQQMHSHFERQGNLLPQLRETQTHLAKILSESLDRPHEFSLDRARETKDLTDLFRSQIAALTATFESKSQSLEDEIQKQNATLAYLATWTILCCLGSLISAVLILGQSLDHEKKLSLKFQINELKAHQASEMKSKFLAQMSHEIRTPMNGLVGVIDLLQTTSLDFEQKSYVQILRDSAHMMLSLVNNILDFSKIEAGRIEIDHELFDLRANLESVIRVFHARANEKEIKLSLVFYGTPPTRVRGDSIRLNQILTNLVGNAIKFTDEGHVTVQVFTQDHWLRVEVNDSGIGIPESERPGLFQSFYQAHHPSLSLKYSGSGLGLSICKQLVERMGGKIGYEPRDTKGSTFWIELPLVAESSTHRKSIPTGQEELVDFQHRFKVLLVEDNPVNGQVFAGMLRKLNLSFRLAENGKAALEILDSETFDLVLMDCLMPVLDGYDTTEAIRNLPFPESSIPIVALTANSMRENVEKCMNVGMNDFISKPVSVYTLQRTLLKYLQPTNDFSHIESALLKLKSLQNHSKSGFYEKLVQTLLAEMPRLIAQAEIALQDLDLVLLERLTHSMKSNFGTIGARFAAHQAALIEEKARQKQVLGAENGLANLREEYRRIEPLLRDSLC